jgi:predicted ATPase/DNA-binding CsgD family transcriptional regulator
LIGVGGAGKSRLATEASTRLAERFPDGLAHVDLAPLATPHLLVGTVAMATATFDAAADSRGLAALERRCLEILADREMLILLDNCEHVVHEAARLVAAILDNCPEIKIIATSREALALAGETVVGVGPMGQAAVELFFARAVAAGAELDGCRDQALVSSICDRLDGIALAVELAAARSRMMALEEIANCLDDVLPLLIAPERDRVDRQATMTRALDWSYHSLGESEAILLRRLAGFRGGWSLAAAEAVCAYDGLEVVTALTGLVDKSLVVADVANRRYRLLEPVRQYAMARLAASGDSATVYTKHLRYLKRLGAEINGRILRSGLDDGDRAELENFRVAIERALAAGDGRNALGLFVSLGWYWVMIGSWREAIEWGTRALASGGFDERHELIGRCMVSGYLSYSGRPGESAAHAARALELLELVPDDYGARYLLSTTLECRGDSPVGILEEAESVAAASGDAPFAAYAARALSRWYVLMWRLEEALAPLDRAESHLGGQEAWFSDNLRIQRGALNALSGTEPAPEALKLAIGDVSRSALTPSLLSDERAMLVALVAEPAQGAALVGTITRRCARDGWMQRVIIDLALAAVVRARLGQADIAIALQASAESVGRKLGYAALPFVTSVGSDILEGAAHDLGPTASRAARQRGATLSVEQAVALAASPVPTPRGGPLSGREVQVLALVASGLDNAAVAEELFISQRTVDAHLSHIRDKLGISSRIGLARWGIERGLAPVPSA